MSRLIIKKGERMKKKKLIALSIFSLGLISFSGCGVNDINTLSNLANGINKTNTIVPVTPNVGTVPIANNINTISTVAAMNVKTNTIKGNEKLEKIDPTTINKIIKKGQTTQEQIKAIFGEPQNTNVTANGKQIWIYSFIKAKSNLFSTNMKTKTLTIEFNKKGIVENYSLSSSKF
jgi:outer membrane protein assembly factor BamE (lipoprotein component of BamABCDE complex)